MLTGIQVSVLVTIHSERLLERFVFLLQLIMQKRFTELQRRYILSTHNNFNSLIIFWKHFMERFNHNYVMYVHVYPLL